MHLPLLQVAILLGVILADAARPSQLSIRQPRPCPPNLRGGEGSAATLAPPPPTNASASVPAHGGGGNVQGQLQGFLEVVTCCADAVLKGTPGMLEGLGSKIPFLARSFSREGRGSLPDLGDGNGTEAAAGGGGARRRGGAPGSDVLGGAKAVVVQVTGQGAVGGEEVTKAFASSPQRPVEGRDGGAAPSTVQVTGVSPPSFYVGGSGQVPEPAAAPPATPPPATPPPPEADASAAADARTPTPPPVESEAQHSPPITPTPEPEQPLSPVGGGEKRESPAAESPPGAAESPPGMTELPPGAAEFLPGAAELPPGAAELPPGAAELPPGTDAGNAVGAAAAVSQALLSDTEDEDEALARAFPAQPAPGSAPSDSPQKHMLEGMRKRKEELLRVMEEVEERARRLNQWTVQFRTRQRVSYGDALFVVGDSPTLGEWDAERAVRMQHRGGDEWTACVTDVPDGTRYKYLVMNHEGVKKRGLFGRGGRDGGGGTFVTAYPLEMTCYMEQCMLEEGVLVQDDTLIDVRFKVYKDGCTEVYVLGSVPCLGEWDQARAVRLVQASKGGAWEAVVAVPSDVLSSFEYKFFCRSDQDGSLQYEEGCNRGSDAGLVEPQRDVSKDGVFSQKRTINLECVWASTLIRFIIFHPLQGTRQVLAASGSHEAMGGWLGAPLRMGLGNERTLLTGVKGRCWEATFPATQDDARDMQYRYLIIDGATDTAIFEREPNRKVECVPGRLSGACVREPTLGLGSPAGGEGEGLRQREFQVYDGNFVPPDLSFDHVPPNLAIGPYPQSEADVQLMKEEGITGVLNVQTDDDHKRRMIDWKTMTRLYEAAGIDVIRVPIEDFHGGELEKLVVKGAKAVDKMVYIHCTAGMGRAPAVACIYKVWKEGCSLKEALKHVKHYRPVAAPNWHAMEAALRHGF